MSPATVYSNCTVGELFLRALKRYPQRIALQHDDRNLTYAELALEIGRYAKALAAHGLMPGDAIALLALNRIETVVLVGAAQVLGLRYTPLHPLGADDDLVFILEDADISCLIVDEVNFAERGRTLAGRVVLPKGMLTLGPAEFGADLSATAAGQGNGESDLRARAEDYPYLLYTGGTTGRPKGVLHSHASWIANTMQLIGEIIWPDQPRFVAATPLSHAAGMNLPAMFLRGTSIHLLTRFRPDAFLAVVQEQRINRTFLPPTAIYSLLDYPHLGDYDYSTLDSITYGAAPIAPARLLQAIRVFGPVLHQAYGQTECLTTVTRLYNFEHDPKRPELLASCGRPVGGTLVRLLDPDLNEVPVGEMGEICIRSPTVMTGYWKRPKETEEAFRGGWLHTGDLARQDKEGFIYIVDRLKDMIVSGGFNVYPREIEDVLAEHPSVAAVAVIGVPDERWGEAVTAVVVCKEGTTVQESELIQLVRDRKGPIHAPKSVDFVSELPLTPIGKPDKKQLRARYWSHEGRQVH